MAKFVFEIDDIFMEGILEGVCKTYSYDAKSGVTREQFFRNVTYSVWKTWYVKQEAIKAAELAEKAAIDATVDLKDKIEVVTPK